MIFFIEVGSEINDFNCLSIDLNGMLTDLGGLMIGLTENHFSSFCDKSTDSKPKNKWQMKQQMLWR